MELFYKPDFLDLLQNYIDEDHTETISFLWKSKPFTLYNKSVFLNDHEILFFDNLPNLEFENCLHNDDNKKLFNYLHFTPNLNFILDKEKMNEAIIKIPLEPCYNMVGNDVACEKCDGSGEVEWRFENYTDDFDCPVCQGGGFKSRAKKVKNGKFQRSILTYIQIGESFFNINYLEKLIKISDFLNEDIELIYQDHKLKANYFKIGLITILIMPCAYDVLSQGGGDVILKINIK